MSHLVSPKQRIARFEQFENKQQTDWCQRRSVFNQTMRKLRSHPVLNKRLSSWKNIIFSFFMGQIRLCHSDEFGRWITSKKIWIQKGNVRGLNYHEAWIRWYETKEIPFPHNSSKDFKQDMTIKVSVNNYTKKGSLIKKEIPLLLYSIKFDWACARKPSL